MFIRYLGPCAIPFDHGKSRLRCHIFYDWNYMYSAVMKSRNLPIHHRIFRSLLKYRSSGARTGRPNFHDTRTILAGPQPRKEKARLTRSKYAPAKHFKDDFAVTPQNKWPQPTTRLWHHARCHAVSRYSTGRDVAHIGGRPESKQKKKSWQGIARLSWSASSPAQSSPIRKYMSSKSSLVEQHTK